MTTALDVLKDARARVAQGWCQGDWSQQGSYCTLGAMTAAAAYNGVFSAEEADFDAFDIAVAAMVNNKVTPFKRFNLVEFNDLPTTTQRDVLALFDRAINELETEQ